MRRVMNDSLEKKKNTQEFLFSLNEKKYSKKKGKISLLILLYFTFWNLTK